jgi:hypothetical protein
MCVQCVRAMCVQCVRAMCVQCVRAMCVQCVRAMCVQCVRARCACSVCVQGAAGLFGVPSSTYRSQSTKTVRANGVSSSACSLCTKLSRAGLSHCRLHFLSSPRAAALIARIGPESRSVRCTSHSAASEALSIACASSVAISAIGYSGWLNLRSTLALSTASRTMARSLAGRPLVWTHMSTPHA